MGLITNLEFTIKIKNNNGFPSTAKIGWALEWNKEGCGIEEGVDVKINKDLSYSYFLNSIHLFPRQVMVSSPNNKQLMFYYMDEHGKTNPIIPKYNIDGTLRAEDDIWDVSIQYCRYR